LRTLLIFWKVEKKLTVSFMQTEVQNSTIRTNLVFEPAVSLPFI
jgi:hypothetical protein